MVSRRTPFRRVRIGGSWGIGGVFRCLQLLFDRCDVVKKGVEDCGHVLMICGRDPLFPCCGLKPGRELGKCRVDGWLCMEALPVGVHVVWVARAEGTLN